jgi:thioredoxin 1
MIVPADALLLSAFPASPPRHWHEDPDMSSELITHTSDASFNADVIEAGTPVLVDYWAEWCGPCKMIAPILDEVSKDYDGKLRIAKMNVDENRDVPAKYGIRGIPTLMLFKDGQLAATKVGALSKAQLTAFIDSHLTGEAAAGKTSL